MLEPLGKIRTRASKPKMIVATAGECLQKCSAAGMPRSKLIQGCTNRRLRRLVASFAGIHPRWQRKVRIQELEPDSGELLFTVAEFGLDDVHPGITKVSGDLDSLVEVRVPFEVIQHSKLAFGDMINFTLDSVPAM